MIGLFYLGGLVSLIGLIWLLVAAFKTSVWWGLGSLFIPFVALIFAIMNWETAKKPFLVYVGGIVLCVVGAMGTHGAVSAMGSSV